MRSNLPFRSGIRAALTLPIMLPGLLIGVSLLTFFTSVLHVSLSNQTAVIGQAVYTTPFVILVVAARLEGFDRSLERAASDLGANTWQRLRYVVLPLIGPAIFAGALFAFTLSLDEFVITLFLIGGGNTLPIYIYTQVKFGITPEINAIATLLIAASVATERGGVPRAQPRCGGCGGAGGAWFPRSRKRAVDTIDEEESMGDRLKVGVIGCGLIAQVMHLPHLLRAR